jgi:hypothetical protein
LSSGTAPAARRAALLDGHVAYRVLQEPPLGDSGRSEPIDVIFVYCAGCGVVIAHTPAGETGDRVVSPLTAGSVTPDHPAGTESPAPGPEPATPVGGRSTPEEVALSGFARHDWAYVVDVRYQEPDPAVVQVGLPYSAAYYWRTSFSTTTLGARRLPPGLSA